MTRVPHRPPHLPPVSEASRTLRGHLILAVALAGYLMALLPNLAAFLGEP